MSIFNFILAVVALGTIGTIAKESLKINERKMMVEAALREEEIKNGFPPGTYSRSFSSKKAYKAMKKAEKSRRKSGFDEIYKEKVEREKLEKGISDLEERIRNLDEIINNRRSKYGTM